MRKKIQRNTRSIEVENNNEYLICFKNTIKALKIFTIFPFINFNEASKFDRFLSITVTMISLGMYTAVNIRELAYLYCTFHNIVREFNFINIIRFILQAIIRFLPLTFPFLTWNRNKLLKKHWHNWMAFQVEIDKLTKTTNKSSARNQIQFLFLLTITSMTSIGILIFKTQLQSSLIKTNLFSILYIFNALGNVSTYWVMNNMYMNAIAKKIVNLVRNALQKDNAANLSHLIDLWIMLCDLNEEFVNCHSIIFLIIFSQIVVAGVLNFFVVIVIWNYFKDKSLVLTYIYGTLICVVTFLLYCESANSVINHMVDKLKKTLLNENIKIKNKESLNMILSFLHTIECRNPKITFQGYMIIDRTIVTSVFGVAINYLIVLKLNPVRIKYE